MLGDRRQRRVALEDLAVDVADAGQLVEVVHQEDAVEAAPFGRLGLGDDRVEDALVGDGWIREVRNLVAEPGHQEPPSVGAPTTIAVTLTSARAPGIASPVQPIAVHAG